MKAEIIKECEKLINGNLVKVKVLKPKKQKVNKYVDRSSTTCPNCQSVLKLNSHKQFECTGNKLKIWEREFKNYERANEKEKEEILAKFSNTSVFTELYDRWKYSLNNTNKEVFDCGYTNIIFPLISDSKEIIPDPIVVKRVELKLGRKLTEDELLGETELFTSKGMVLTKWKPKAKRLNIPWIVLPSENEIYV